MKVIPRSLGGKSFKSLLTWKWRSWTQLVEYHWHLEWAVCHRVRLSHLSEHIEHNLSCPLITHSTLSHCNNSPSHCCVPSGDTVLRSGWGPLVSFPVQIFPMASSSPFPRVWGTRNLAACLQTASMIEALLWSQQSLARWKLPRLVQPCFFLPHYWQRISAWLPNPHLIHAGQGALWLGRSEMSLTSPWPPVPMWLQVERTDLSPCVPSILSLIVSWAPLSRS